MSPVSQIIKNNTPTTRGISNNKVAHNKNKNISNNSLVSASTDYCKGLTTIYFFDRYSRYSTLKRKGLPQQEVFSTYRSVNCHNTYINIQ